MRVEKMWESWPTENKNLSKFGTSLTYEGVNFECVRGMNIGLHFLVDKSS